MDSFVLIKHFRKFGVFARAAPTSNRNVESQGESHTAKQPHATFEFGCIFVVVNIVATLQKLA